MRIPLSNRFLTPCESPTTPVGKSVRFGLFRFRSPLLTESIFLSFPPGTEMFQFSGLAARTYGLGSRLFGNLRIKACLTAPRSFSQFSAPFKAFRRQDVPHALFLRLIASIHHSSRNNRPTCSLFRRYTIETLPRLLAKPKKQNRQPTASFPTRST